jgi:hypothetical protein
MSDFRGTPWEVVEGGYSNAKGEFSVWEAGAEGDGARRVACWIRSAEVARLIAAAPDLLAALVEARGGVKDDDPAMWARVDAAIAKAAS